MLQVPVLFTLKPSLLLLGSFLALSGVCWYRDRRREFGKVSLLPWRTLMVLLWGLSFLAALQVLKQLPSYFTTP